MTHRFDTWESWCIVGRCRAKQLLEGLYGVVVIWLFWGVASLFIHAGRQVNAFYRRETRAAALISVLLVLLCVGWVTTFVRERAAVVSAQHRADSLAYDLSRYSQMFDTTDLVIVNGDTLKGHW